MPIQVLSLTTMGVKAYNGCSDGCFRHRRLLICLKRGSRSLCFSERWMLQSLATEGKKEAL